MKLGIISSEINTATTAELFRKAKDYGFNQMQFDYISVNAERMPAFIEDSLNQEIAVEAARNGIEITALCGTFNMAHPDSSVRQDGIVRFEKIAASCNILGSKLVSLCTGSRNRDNMWASHHDNDTAEAWKDMYSTMEQLILIADKYNINLGIETEASNVINTPEKAKKIIEDLKSKRLKIIFDGANLFQIGMAKRENVKGVISRGIDILGPWIALVHGKDIKEGEGLNFCGPGQGIMDYGFFISELEKIGFNDGMILHGIKNENNIPGCVEYLRKSSF